MIRFLVNSILALLVILIQISFLPFLSQPLNQLNLILTLIIFFTLIINKQLALWLAFGSGLILDLFSNLPFGSLTLSLLITVSLVNFLSDNFFARRSSYSLALLGIIGTISYEIFILLANLINYFVGQNRLTDFINLQSLYNLIWQIFLNLTLLILLLLVINFISRKLRSVFLLPRWLQI